MAVLFDSDAIAAYAQQVADDLGPPQCGYITTAIPLAGLSYEDPATRDEYVEQLYFWGVFPQDSDGNYDVTQEQINSAYAMAAAQSTCGITTRRVWRGAGVDAPQIYDFYGNPNRVGSTIVYEHQWADSVGAWSSGVPWVEGTPWPGPGDACIIGCGSCGGDWSRNSYNGEHEFTVLANDDDGVVYSLDGGQPGILFRTRRILEVWTGTNDQGQQTGELWAAAVEPDGSTLTDANGRPLTGRRFVGICRAADMPVRPELAPACGSALSRVEKLLPAKGPLRLLVEGGLVVAGVGLTALALRAGARAWQKRRGGRLLTAR